MLDVTTVPVVAPYRPETKEWAARVDWALICRLAIEIFERGDFDDLDALQAAIDANRLDEDHMWALAHLRNEPICASPKQISNGVHRLAAMRAQGVRWTVQFY